MSSFLADYESSMEDTRAISAWIELKNRFEEGKTIDKEIQKPGHKKTRHWNNVLSRTVSCRTEFTYPWNSCFSQTIDFFYYWSICYENMIHDYKIIYEA